MWTSNKSFKVINNVGMEKFYEISSDGTLSETGYGIVPMFDLNLVRNTENFHFYLDQKPLLQDSSLV